MMEKRVIITGGTGFIGSRLCHVLLDKGYSPVVLSRDPAKVSGRFGGRVKGAAWDGKSSDGWAGLVEGAFGIVNLAGAGIGSGRWTRSVKNAILKSRVNAGNAVMDAVRAAEVKPAAIIQGSAIGYYGDRGEELLDESGSRGEGFLPDVVEKWEASTAEASSMGVRVAAVRTAMVLGKGGMLLDRLELPLRLFAGGPMGSGRQWVSWIHLEDEVRAICFLLERDDLKGVFNLSSPSPVRNADLMSSIGAAIGRPSWIRTPAFVLRAVLGEMADELVLAGARVKPSRLLEAGFEFDYSDLESALGEIYG